VLEDVPVMTAVLLVLLFLAIARVEHIVASDIWILVRGRDFRTRLDSLMQRAKERKRLAEPRRRWMLYKEFDGGRLPWLFFGIQSTRLLALSSTSSGVLRVLLRLVRGAWRFYAFAPAVLLAVVVCVWSGDDPRTLDSWLALAVMAVLVLGCVGIAAGGVLASMRMGAFARYHHFGWPPAKDRDLAHHELSLVAGSALIAFLCVAGLVLIIGSEFHGYDFLSSQDSRWTQTWNAALIALMGVLGLGTSEPVNGFGAFGVFAASLTQACYLVILLVATSKTWAG
jgi:hypothetical protein